ncbi:MAG: aldo/keto reductase [Actinomycetota bacterium]
MAFTWESCPAQIGFGAWGVGGEDWGPGADWTTREKTVQLAAERGVVVFDTAPTYGESEELLGRVLKQQRAKIVLATKVGPRDDPRASLEVSLRKLDTEYVDLLQLHEVGDNFERSLQELSRLKEEGKALAIGLCNATGKQLSRALEFAPLSTYQAAYNLFDREVEQKETPLCRKHKLSFLAYRSLASGVLTDTFSQESVSDLAPDDHRHGIWWFKGPELARRVAVLDRLRQIAAKGGRTVSALAIGWALNQPGVSVVLAGARTPKQLEENLEAKNKPLEGEEIAAVNEAVAEVFKPAAATQAAREAAAEWGGREQFIVDRLDGRTSYDSIAAEWSEAEDTHLMGAQVRQFVDQLAAEGMVTP